MIKEEIVTLRLTKKQLDQLKEIAAVLNVSVSEALRLCIRYQEIERRTK